MVSLKKKGEQFLTYCKPTKISPGFMLSQCIFLGELIFGEKFALKNKYAGANNPHPLPYPSNKWMDFYNLGGL